MIISPASFSDLPEIHALQRLAFQTEAEILQDWTIQPLTETLEEVQKEFEAGPVLKACDEKTGQIVGSIRGQVNDRTLFFAKLVVHPDFRRQGIGRALLEELEKTVPHQRAELFTRADNLGNVHLYESVGFRQVRTVKENEKLSFVFFEK